MRSPGRVPSLRLYFGLLFVLVVVGAFAGVVFIDRSADAEARQRAQRDALFSARTAAKQLNGHAQLLKATAADLAANPQITAILANPTGCTLTFHGLGGPDRGHLDIIRADGTVACSSKALTPRATTTGYGRSSWLRRSLSEPVFLAPMRDELSGAQTAIATAPIPGGKGAVVAFADLTALGAHLAEQYGGGRANVFLVTTGDDRVVVARSRQPERWIGTQIERGQLNHRNGAEWLDLEGHARLFARAAAPAAGWNVYVGEDKSSVLASVASLRKRQLQTIAVSLLVLLLAAALVYRKVAAPIRRLSDSVRSTNVLEDGETVPPTGPAEVRALAEDVNFLTASVRNELQQRRASEESYRLLFESNPSPMWVFDAETRRFLAVNDAAVDAYGYTRDEFLAMSIDDIRSADEAARLHQTLNDTRDEHGLRHAGLWNHRRKDGTEFDAEIHSHDHRFEGRPARVVIALDVTEREESERLRRESEERYRDLFENATDLIAVVDLDGKLTAVNEAFVRAVGYSREELLETRIDDLVPEDRRGRLAEARKRKLDGLEKASVYEHELIARDGHRIQIEVASRLIMKDGRPVGTEAICRDISERKHLEEQLRQAQRLEAIGRLAGGVAHDFNNLLTVISGYAETLLDGRDRQSEPELDQIARAAERASILTRQLLAFSRRQVLQPRVVSMNGVVDELTPMLTRLIGEDVELIASPAVELDPVLADPSQLEQVILNLAVNARDAMPRGGKLTIQTANVELDEDYVAHHGEATVGPHVMLAVSDTGTGIDAETLSHMFEPFFTTKPSGTGTGLGLATVYGIVKQSGGSIWIYSEPGAGTTFKIYLPRATSDAPEELVAPRPVSRAANGTETILIAEDEPALRSLGVRILEKFGYEVIAAESATEALRIVEANGRRFDLLLTDLIMPELSGAELARRVSALVPGIRVLFMSGYADDMVTKNGALEAGAPFLEKPFTANELATRVRELLDS